MKVTLNSGDVYGMRAIIGHRLAFICDKARGEIPEVEYRYWATTYDTTFEVAVNLDRALLMTKEPNIRDCWASSFPFPAMKVDA